MSVVDNGGHFDLEMNPKDELFALFNLWTESQDRVDELESNYLTTFHLKDEPVSVILVDLWKQTIPGSELRERFEEMLKTSKDVERLQYDENSYTFVALK